MCDPAKRLSNVPTEEAGEGFSKQDGDSFRKYGTVDAISFFASVYNI